MGCLRLTYQETFTPLNVVYNDLNASDKCFLGGYRYGFQGQEKDDEVKGEGNSYDFGNRIHDPRVGRFWSIDAIEKPHQSPYSFAGNNPIAFVDINGDDNIIYLVVLPTSEGLIDTKFDAELVAEYANQMLSQLCVNTEVRIFVGSEFDESLMDPTDAVAYVGNPMDLNEKVLHPNLKVGYDGDSFDDLGMANEPGNWITISAMSASQPKYNIPLGDGSIEKTIAFGIIHESSHSAGVGHFEKNPDIKDDINTPTYAWDGGHIIGKINNFDMSYIDFLIPELQPKTMEAHRKRFGENQAQDNYYRNQAIQEDGFDPGPNTLAPVEVTAD